MKIAPRRLHAGAVETRRRRAATASGAVALAPVSLRELRIGQLSRRGVAAVVNSAEMPISLLGMSFLSGLERWEAQDDRLMLYW